MMEELPQAARRSGVRFKDLISLFVTPKAFFRDVIDAVTPTKFTYLAAYVVGLVTVMDRFDTQMARAQLETSYARASRPLDLIGDSWPTYWALVLFGGLISAVFYWFVSGWWYRKRLMFAGATNVAPDVARSVCTWQFLVMSIPGVVSAVLDTIAYSSFNESWKHQTVWSTLLVVFPFWSTWVSHVAATTQFELRVWPARAWFIVLPITFYLLILGFFAAALTGLFS